MINEAMNDAVALMFPMIFGRLKEAQHMAEAANICIAVGNPEGALRILENIEGLTADAATLSRAARLIRREREG